MKESISEVGFLDAELAIRALDDSNDGILICDATKDDMPVIYANHAFELLTGYSRKELLNNNCRFLQNNDRGQPELELVRSSLNNNLACRVRLRNYKKNGELFYNELSLSPIFDKNKKINYYLGIQKDVTQEVTYQKRILYLTRHDDLTLLYNHRGFYFHVNKMILMAQRTKYHLGVGVVDIDKFKMINGRYGHMKGDEVLRALGNALKQNFRRIDVLARMGGDEFFIAFLCEKKANSWFAKKIEKAVEQAKQSVSGNIDFQVSKGFYLDEVNKHTILENFIKKADDLMYQEKQKHRLK